MFDLYGCYFEYDGFESVDYDLIFGNIDTSRIMALESARNVNTIRSKINNKNYITRVSYDKQSIEFDAEIVTSEGTVINETDVPFIEKALFTKATYGKLKPVEFREDRPVYINCIFINPERIEVVGGIAGFKFTIVTDSVMAWEEEQAQTFTSETIENDTVIVKVDSDMDEYIYHEVAFTIGNTGGDISLYNNTDDPTRITGFTALPPSIMFTMECDVNQITSDAYSYFTDMNFIRLKNGENEFVLDGDIQSISFTFKNRKYI